MDAFEKELVENSKPIAGKWVVHTKGGPNRATFEICVIREGYNLGFSSYGWFEEDKKLLISHNGGPCSWPVIDRVWNKLVAIAHEVADSLNIDEAF